MRTPEDLFKRNRRWAADMVARRPDFFARLAAQQLPEYLWIGCSDSRVPASEIVDVLPGEIFVHRNVANVVVHTDLNCLSVIQFAVDVLKVKYVIVCGHYGCGGVRAALEDAKLGLIENWLRHIQDVRTRYQAIVDGVAGKEAQVNRLCELNVLQQAVHVCETTVVQDAWRRGQPLAVHAWIYGLEDGHLRDLGFHAAGPEELRPALEKALETFSS